MPTWPQRVKAWFAEQTPLSLATLSVGAAALALSLGGSIVLILASGPIPHERILRTITSSTQALLLVFGAVLGGLALATGALIYHGMPTKPSREGAVSGAALGAQSLLFSSIYLWFRTGERLDIFVRQFFNFELLREFGGQFVNGAKNTVFLALVGEGLGILIGLALSFLVLSRRVVVRAPARAYINFFRGTPLLWQLQFGLFGLALGLRLDLPVFYIAILVLGLNAGAYTAEIFRAGIQSIERGQMEAARSVGMTYMQAMLYVILPQAIRRVIPPLTNEFVILIKDTSLIVILGLTFAQRELMQVGRDAYSETFNATPFLASAVGYLIVTLPMIRAVNWLERRLRSGLAGIAGM
jgi:polar amino acid transport system permease protein